MAAAAATATALALAIAAAAAAAYCCWIVEYSGGPRALAALFVHAPGNSEFFTSLISPPPPLFLFAVPGGDADSWPIVPVEDSIVDCGEIEIAEGGIAMD